MGHHKSEMSVCRLCSGTDDIFDVFHLRLENGKQLRDSILLATGIHITPTDQVSKMVCHRCCEIALKLCKYRINAVANDTLLKERYGQPCLPSITDQDELLRIASRILAHESSMCNDDILLDEADLHNPLELLNFSSKKEIVHQAPSVERLSEVQLYHDPKQTTRESTNKREEGPLFIKPPKKDDNARKSVFKLKYKHPSVRELFKTYKGIILPQKVFKSDVSPVISLDSTEIYDWHKNQLKEKLLNVIIKKVPNSSTYRISSIPPSTEHVAVPSSHQEISNSSDTNIVISPKQTDSISSGYKQTPTADVIHASEFNTDVNRAYAFNYDHQKENNIPQGAPQISSSIQHAITPADTNTLHISKRQRSIKQLNSHKNTSSRKNNRRHPTKRKRALLNDYDYIEVIPEKKKRIYCNKNALKTLNKMDLPYVCPSDKNEQKAIFTSSLELRPVAPLPRPAYIEISSSTPVVLPEVDTTTTSEIFSCAICHTAYDTNQKLVDHTNTHIRCKFCNDILENLDLLRKHHKESCSQYIVNNQPCIELERIDTVLSVVEKYPQAFEKPCTGIPERHGIDLLCYEHIGEIKRSTAIPSRAIIPNPCYSSVTKSRVSSTNTTNIPLNHVTTLPTMDKQLSPITDLSEHEMIQHLFTKYSPRERPQKYTISISDDEAFQNWKIIKINKMFTDLLAYKVPIQIESGPEFKVTIKKRVSTVEHHPVSGNNQNCYKQLTVTSACVSHSTTVSNSVVPSSLSVANNLTNRSSKVGSPISSAGTIITAPQNNTSVASPNFQAYNRNSTALNMYSKSNIAPNRTLGVPSTSTVQSTEYIYQQQTKSVSSNSTIPIHSSQNFSSTFLKNQEHYKKLATAMNAVWAMPKTMPASSLPSACVTDSTTVSNSVVASLLRAESNLTNGSSKVGSPISSAGTITTVPQNNTSVAFTNFQGYNRNSAVSNMYSVNNRRPKRTLSVPSTSTVECTEYIHQRQTKSVPSSSTTNATHVSQNNAPAVLKNQDYYKKLAPAINAVEEMPKTMPVSSANSLRNMTSVPAVITCDNSYQTRYSNFMQGAIPKNSMHIAQQPGVVNSLNNTMTNTNAALPKVAANNIYDATLNPAKVYSNAPNQQYVAHISNTKSTNSKATCSNQQTLLNNNITSANQAVFTGNMQNFPVQMGNTYQTPFLYNTNSNYFLPYKYSNQISKVGTGNQQNMVTASANVSYTQHVRNGMIRVKTTEELS